MTAQSAAGKSLEDFLFVVVVVVVVVSFSKVKSSALEQ